MERESVCRETVLQWDHGVMHVGTSWLFLCTCSEQQDYTYLYIPIYCYLIIGIDAECVIKWLVAMVVNCIMIISFPPFNALGVTTFLIRISYVLDPLYFSFLHNFIASLHVCICAGCGLHMLHKHFNHFDFTNLNFFFVYIWSIFMTIAGLVFFLKNMCSAA